MPNLILKKREKMKMKKKLDWMLVNKTKLLKSFLNKDFTLTNCLMTSRFSTNTHSISLTNSEFKLAHSLWANNCDIPRVNFANFDQFS